MHKALVEKEKAASKRTNERTNERGILYTFFWSMHNKTHFFFRRRREATVAVADD